MGCVDSILPMEGCIGSFHELGLPPGSPDGQETREGFLEEVDFELDLEERAGLESTYVSRHIMDYFT